MTLADSFLARLAEWRPTPTQPTCTVADAASGWTIHLTADYCDQVGCRIQELSVSRNVPVANLQGWAEGLTQKVSGLLEPLRVLEIDTSLKAAVLRSVTPAQRGDSLQYYEVMLEGHGKGTLRRYLAKREGGARREPIAFALTLEAAAKFVQDLTNLA